MDMVSMPYSVAEQTPQFMYRPSERTCFFLTANTDARLLARILDIFAKIDLTPHRVHLSSEHGAGEEMSVELRFTDLTPQLTEKLANRCRAVIGVRSVITASGV